MRTLVVALLLLLGAPAQAAPPKPSVSEYFRSTNAGFAMSAEGGVQYAVSFAVLKHLSSPGYVTVLFENTSGKGEPTRKVLVLPPGATELSVKSDRITAIGNGKRYEVQVNLYEDEERTRLLGKHKQQVEFAIPSAVVAQLSKQFSVDIR